MESVYETVKMAYRHQGRFIGVDKTRKPPSKKHKKSSTGGTRRDRFSELPNEVIVHILSFLPIYDAVKTVLLHRCGNLWTMVPSLCFSDYGYHNSKFPFFLNFVRNVLMFHKSPTIEEFHLKTVYQGPDVETWTQFALSREAKVLKLHIYDHLSWFTKRCTLPRCILKNQTLVSLKIHGCNIEQQSQVHMGSLRKLVLKEVCFGDKMLEQIVSGCPSLEELSICSVDTDTNMSLCVTSTNIKFLKLKGSLRGTIDCPYLKTLHVSCDSSGLEIANLCSPSEVKIENFGYPSEIHNPLLLSLLEKVGNAEVLKLTDSTLDMLADCSMRKLSWPSSRWKHLILNSRIDKLIILAICGLVRNSASLEELTVYVPSQYIVSPMMERLNDSMFVEELSGVLVEELSTPCVMSKLKIVTIHGSVWHFEIEDKLPLVEFLLKNAVNLEKLVFVCDLTGSLYAPEIEFIKQVASFRRASSNATVVFA